MNSDRISVDRYDADDDAGRLVREVTYRAIAKAYMEHTADEHANTAAPGKTGRQAMHHASEVAENAIKAIRLLSEYGAFSSSANDTAFINAQCTHTVNEILFNAATLAAYWQLWVKDRLEPENDAV